jgi:alpha-glucosidase/alpha-D-xyloside xylohydrolase
MGGRTVTRPVDLATMPIFVRAGAIIPVDPVRQYTAEPVSEPTTIRIYQGADGQYTLYDDDGVSQEYLHNRGSWTRFTWNDASRRLTIGPATPPGAVESTRRRTFDVVLLPDESRRTVTYTGSSIQIVIR